MALVSALNLSSALGESGSSSKNLFIFDSSARESEFKAYLTSMELSEPYAQTCSLSEVAEKAPDLKSYAFIYVDLENTSSFEDGDSVQKLIAAETQVVVSCVSDTPAIRGSIAKANPDIAFYGTESVALNKSLLAKQTVASCVNAEKANGLMVCLKQAAEEGKSAAIYCNHHSDAKNLASVLSKRDLNVLQHTFSNKPRSFHKPLQALSGDKPVFILGTDESLKGLYHDKIGLVIHYDVAESSIAHVARYAQCDAMGEPYESVVFVCDESGVNLLSINESLIEEWKIEKTQPVSEAFPLGDLEAVTVPSRAERKAEAKRRRQEEKRNGGRRGGPRGKRDGGSDRGPRGDRPPRRDDKREDSRAGSNKPAGEKKQFSDRDRKPRREAGSGEKPNSSRPRRDRPQRSNSGSGGGGDSDGRPGRRRRGVSRDSAEGGEKTAAAKGPRDGGQQRGKRRASGGRDDNRNNNRSNNSNRHKGNKNSGGRSKGLRKPVDPNLGLSNTESAQGGLLSKVGTKIKKFFTFS